MRNEIFVAESAAARVDVFLADNLDLTRSQIKKLVDSGGVKLSGTPVKAGAPVKAGDVVEVNIPDYVCNAAPENIPLDIVYEDGELAVINKPQGMVVHPAPGVYTGTLVNALMYHYSTLSDVGGELRAGIVHRLDKDTSGLLVVAKTNRAHAALALQIASKTALRLYRAVLEGVVKPDGGEISGNIARDPRDRKRFILGNTGKYSISYYTVLERFLKHTLCEFRLGTGRTHQIRVHAKAIGHPVAGDPVYGYVKRDLKLNGQLLHAYRLSFEHPVTGERMEFTREPPPAFDEALTKLRAGAHSRSG
jgi:23S rRNA pseudouridine1911/1915/1917 synthase